MMGTKRENGRPPPILLDCKSRKLTERLQNITVAMAWISGELEGLKESDQVLLDIFKQLEGDVVELNDLCAEVSPRKLCRSGEFNFVVKPAEPLEPSFSSDLDFGVRHKPLLPHVTPHRKAPPPPPTHKTSPRMKHKASPPTKHKPLPCTPPSPRHTPPVTRASPPIPHHSLRTELSVESDSTLTSSKEELPALPLPTRETVHPQLNPSSSSGSDFLGAVEDVSASPRAAKRLAEGMKGSDSLSKLANGSSSISRLQEDSGSTISRNSSIDSGIQFVSESENNGLGSLFDDVLSTIANLHGQNGHGFLEAQS